MSDLKLEWTCARTLMDPCWEAYVGIFTLRVRDRVTHSQWDIDIRGVCGELHNAESVLAAQLAAESAARDLLCTALAAFADKAPNWSVHAATSEPDPKLQVRYASANIGWPMERSELRRVALALLKASEEKTP